MVNLEKLLTRIEKRKKDESTEDPFAVFLKTHGMKFNPFQDKVVDDLMFINKDKDALVRILRATLHNQSSLSIMIGPTGSGKSENADFLVKKLPEEYVYWYNQIYGQTALQLGSSILEGLDPKFAESIKKKKKDIMDTFNRVLMALPRKNKKLFCIFDQGENFSKDALDFVINCTNPHYDNFRSFSALILAVPRFEKRLERWLDNYDTAIRRSLVKEYVRPFTSLECAEYIIRGIALSRGIEYSQILKLRDFDPFEKSAIERIIEICKGHPSTLCDLCYLSMEIACETSPHVLVLEEHVKEAWKKYPNKTLHREAIKWYINKGLVREDAG